MKSGAGDDPFAEDPAAESDGDEAETEHASGAESTDAEDPAMTGGGQQLEAVESGTESGSETAPSGSEPEIPWVLRRGSVKGDRDNVHQFFLRDDTARGERELRNEVETILDTEVSKLDLREAAYLVAMQHPDEVAAQLRDWGYEYL